MRARKRSAAITLVLAGSAGLGGCGSPVEQRDAYASQAACVKDWGNDALCEPVRDGRYASSYFYGPAYYGNGTTYSLFGRTRSPTLVASPNAMDVQRVSSGTVASSHTSQLAMRSGAGSSNVSRSGFGSSASARASSSGS